VVTTSGPTGTVTLTPAGTWPNVTYTAGSLPSPLFNGGDTLSISAPGGPDVPAFSGHVVAPAAIAGYAPPTSISRGAGLTISWTAGSATNMGVFVFAGDTSTGDIKALICTGSDTGSMTVSPTQLGLLPAANTYGGVMLIREQSTVVSAGAWSIALQALQNDQSGTVGDIPIGP